VARDAELDRLKAAQDREFQHKQDAWKTQDQAWQRRSAAREAMNRAYDGKQRTYEAQETSWQDYQRVRSSNGPQIDRLNAQQESAFQDMKRAFDNASAAHDRRDGASARSYADQGHRYKAEAQGCVDQRRRLVAEIRSVKDRHEATKPAFQCAKGQFDQSRSEHDRAKADHERKQAEFKRAKSDFDRAKDAFGKRLAVVRAESRRRKDDKRALIDRAGIPHYYRDKVWISREPDGTVNLYFGGVGEPTGPGHGHYVLDASGTVTYRRDPFDPHGSQNFEDKNGSGDKLRKVGLITEAIITGVSVYGALSSPPQSGYAPLKDEADTSVYEERTKRARIQRGATRDKGWESGNSSQQ